MLTGRSVAQALGIDLEEFMAANGITATGLAHSPTGAIP